MRVLIEVVADDRTDVLTLASAAVAELRRGKERSGEQASSCLGDYRITVTEEARPETPYMRGDRVLYTEHVGLSERTGTHAIVQHSGPGFTGVRFADGQERIVSNETLTFVAKEDLVADVPLPPVTKQKQRVESLRTRDGTCPCGDPNCPTGPECFGGSDYPGTETP